MELSTHLEDGFGNECILLYNKILYDEGTPTISLVCTLRKVTI